VKLIFSEDLSESFSPRSLDLQKNQERSGGDRPVLIFSFFFIKKKEKDCLKV
jgi:hypothetical protein